MLGPEARIQRGRPISRTPCRPPWLTDAACDDEAPPAAAALAAALAAAEVCSSREQAGAEARW